MTVHCSHSELVDPATLKPNPANPNRHSAHQIQLLAEIIKEQGWRSPITVSNRSGLIVRGHGRLEAALLMGCERVPVDMQDYESEAAELADLLADNRLSELAELDEDDLKKVIERLREADPSFDTDLTGFVASDLDKLFEEEADPADELETIPAMESQAFEHYDYLVFLFKDLRDWMKAIQGVGVGKVNYSISRKAQRIGIGRVLRGERLLKILESGTANQPGVAGPFANEGAGAFAVGGAIGGASEGSNGGAEKRGDGGAKTASAEGTQEGANEGAENSAGEGASGGAIQGAIGGAGADESRAAEMKPRRKTSPSAN
jgi:hypothetical protein